MLEPTATLVDGRQVAARLGISLSFWRKMVASARAPQPVRLGRARRWVSTEIDAWVSAGCPAEHLWKEMKVADA